MPLLKNIKVEVPVAQNEVQDFEFLNRDDDTQNILVVDMLRYRKGSHDCVSCISGAGGYSIRRDNFISITILPLLDTDAKTLLGVQITTSKRGVPFFKGEFSLVRDGYTNIIFDKTGYYV